MVWDGSKTGWGPVTVWAMGKTKFRGRRSRERATRAHCGGGGGLAPYICLPGEFLGRGIRRWRGFNLISAVCVCSGKQHCMLCRISCALKSYSLQTQISTYALNILLRFFLIDVLPSFCHRTHITKSKFICKRQWCNFDCERRARIPQSVFPFNVYMCSPISAECVENCASDLFVSPEKCVCVCPGSCIGPLSRCRQSRHTAKW